MTLQNDFSIVRLTPRDAHGRSDHFLDLRQTVLEKEDVYPGIDKWFDKKVISGIGSQSRVAYVGYLDQIPTAAAIIKLGSDAKICHVSVKPDLQNFGLGDLFLCLLALEGRRYADTIHLTLPESLWQSKGQFFEGFGFTKIEKAGTQYRLFDQELETRTPFKILWASVLSKVSKLSSKFSLSGNALTDGVLFSIRPDYGEMIMSGSKRIELRRRFSKRWKGHRAVFYATEPVRGLIGQATIQEVHEGAPETIWERFRAQIRCSREYFNSYVANCKNVFAIELTNISPFVDPIFAATLSQYVGKDLVPPQSYLHLYDQNSWSEAVNISVMLRCLHSRLALSPPTLQSQAKALHQVNSPVRLNDFTSSNSLLQQQELFGPL
jgi:predicted transcriptional regulator